MKTPTETDHYQNSEVCQKCANCCKAFWQYTTSEDQAMRYSLLDTDKISVAKINEKLWKITINIPCKELIEKDGKYWCRKYDSPNRPEFCKTYPANFKGAPQEQIEEESKLCSLIKDAVDMRDDELDKEKGAEK
jgi:Fe-S-cluster containining protein